MFGATSLLLFAFALAAEDAAKSKLNNLKLTIANGHIVEIYGETVTHQITYERLRCLRFCFWLKKLKIDDESLAEDPPVTCRALEHVAGLKNLEELSWYDVPGLSTDNLALLKQCPALRRLTTRPSKQISLEMLKVIGSFPKLESLSIHQARFEPSAAKGFEDMKLKALDLGGCKFDEGIIKHMKNIKGLRELRLPETLPDDDLAKLNQLSSLEVLRTDENMSDRHLATVAELTELRELGLNGAAVTDEGIKHVAKLAKLEVLKASFTRITGQALVTLKGCQRLRSLDLSYNAITLEDLRALQAFKSLASLSLGGVAFNDRAVDYLTELTSLEHLDLTFARLSKEAIKRLQAKLPKCKIVTKSE